MIPAHPLFGNLWQFFFCLFNTLICTNLLTTWFKIPSMSFIYKLYLLNYIRYTQVQPLGNSFLTSQTGFNCNNHIVIFKLIQLRFLLEPTFSWYFVSQTYTLCFFAAVGSEFNYHWLTYSSAMTLSVTYTKTQYYTQKLTTRLLNSVEGADLLCMVHIKHHSSFARFAAGNHRSLALASFHRGNRSDCLAGATFQRITWFDEAEICRVLFSGRRQPRSIFSGGKKWRDARKCRIDSNCLPGPLEEEGMGIFLPL